MKFECIKLEYILAPFCIGLAFIPFPSLLGLWESNTLFHLLTPEHIWINTILHPRANIGGYEYATMDLTRWTVDLFGLNFFSIHLLTIIYGFGALYVFYSILQTWCSPRNSILATALLASNATFLVFQHQLIIAIFDFFCILLCIKGYLISRACTKKNIIFFGIVCALTSLFYHTGRYIMLFLIALWVFDIYFIDKRENGDIKKALKTFFLTFVLTLFVLNPVSLYRFFNLKFLIPEEGGAGNNEFAMNASDFLINLQVNIPLIFHSFLGRSEFYGDYASEISFGIAYQLLNIPSVLLLIVGIAIILLKRDKLLISLFLIIIFVPALSMVWPHNWSSLSPYRLFYALIPLYLVIGIGINYFGKHKIVSLSVQGMCVLLIAFQTYQYVQEIQRVNHSIETANCEFQINDSKMRKYRCNSEETRYDMVKQKEKQSFEEKGYYFSPYAEGYRIYEKFILPYRVYANEISEKVKNIDDNITILIDAPTTDFDSVNSHIQHFNYHQLFLALYLSDYGLDVNYFVPYPRKLSFPQRVLSWAVTRFATTQPSTSGGTKVSRHLNYPLRLQEGEYLPLSRDFWEKLASKIVSFNLVSEELIRKIIPKAKQYIATKNTGSESHIYLVTSNLERKRFKELFNHYITISL